MPMPGPPEWTDFQLAVTTAEEEASYFVSDPSAALKLTVDEVRLREYVLTRPSPSCPPRPV